MRPICNPVATSAGAQRARNEENAMQCYPRKVGDGWYVVFRCLGSRYTASLRTGDEREADVRLGPIKDAIYRIEKGLLEVPPGADVRSFVLAGGRIAERPATRPRTTLGELPDLYLNAMRQLEENSRLTVRIHLNHAVRILKARTPLIAVDLARVDEYVRVRLSEDARPLKAGKGPSPRKILGYTVAKELTTLRAAMSWAAAHGHAESPPTWATADVSLPKDRGREPFRTYDEIVEIVRRRGLDADEEGRLWECLYLTGPEVRDLLKTVERAAADPWVYPMVAFVAMTGCRRAEMARSLVDDWDLGAGRVSIREKKRDKSVDVTTRDVDLHPELARAMKAWFAIHPGGSFAISPSGGPVRADTASEKFKEALSGHPKWSKVRGFHVLRHSVASVLASEGVDQRYIDKILGHQTEAMRKRYQHLTPGKVKAAIGRLF
ncbi:site-specific integrase [Paludisphaera soli]|uniref:site-specific integrase n=1 Tax=Paludisphaera soli TaxID=2712865 RepID=UPI001F0F75B8|nr:site-specific integrase [Paludisphaera soli]